MLALSGKHFYTWPITLKLGALKVWVFYSLMLSNFSFLACLDFLFSFLNADLLCVWKLFYIVPLSPCETSSIPGRYGPCPFNCNFMGCT